MALTLVGAASWASGDSNGGTSASFDSTGAKVIVVCLGDTTVDAGAITDNQANTYIALTGVVLAIGSRIYYCINPVTSATHTVSVAGTATYPSFEVILIGSNSGQSVAFDQENQDIAFGTTSVQAGAITPAANGAFVVACAEINVNETVNINGGYTVTDHEPTDGSFHVGTIAAYLIQTTAASTNPTWSWTSTVNGYACIASFVPVAANVTRSPTVGSLTLSGGTATVVSTANRLITPTVGALTLTGGLATVTRTQSGIITPLVGSLTLSGGTPVVQATSAIVRSPLVGSLTLTGNTVTLLRTVARAPTSGSLTLTGGSIGIAFEGPQSGTLTLTGGTPTRTVGTGVTRQPTVGSLTLAGGTPTATITSFAVTITPQAGALALSGGTVTPQFAFAVAPQAGSLALSGGTVSVLSGQSPTPTSGALTLAGGTVTLQSALVASPQAGALTLTGGVPTAALLGPIVMSSGSLTLTGNRPRAIDSGNPGGGGDAAGGLYVYRYRRPR